LDRGLKKGVCFDWREGRGKREEGRGKREEAFRSGNEYECGIVDN